MQEKLAASGFAWALQLFSMTLKEIYLALETEKMRHHRRQQDLWLLARYAALAFHAPDKLPPPPDGAMPPMTDEAMKARLLAWRREEQ